MTLGSSCILTTDAGGNSLITHNTNAEGIDEPGKKKKYAHTTSDPSKIYLKAYTRIDKIPLFQKLTDYMFLRMTYSRNKNSTTTGSRYR